MGNGAVWLIARSSIRRQAGTIALLALLIGVTGAVVLATVGGARRTSTVLDRFGAFSQSADVEVTVGEATPEQLAEFAATPEVAEFAPLRQFAMPLHGSDDFLPTAGAVDDRFGSVVDRPLVVAGRVPDNAEPDELAIGEGLAQKLKVDVGDTLVFDAYTPAQIEEAFATERDPGPPAGRRVETRIVGVVRRPLDLSGRGAMGGVVVPTPAFTSRYGAEIGSFAGIILRVRAEHGEQDVPAILASARRVFGSSPAFMLQALGIDTAAARDAVDVWTVGLSLFAAIAGLVAAVFIAIIVSRQLAGAERDQPTLAALGMSRARRRAVAAAAPALPMAGAGALLAVVGAAVASPLFPLGVAGRAETSPGVDIDWPLLALGLVAVTLFVVAIGAVAGFRASRATSTVVSETAVRPSRLARSARQAGLSPTASTGLGFAFEGGVGRGAVPVRSAMLASVLGVIGLSAVLVYASSFDHLVSTPSMYGWSFDTVVLSEVTPGTGKNYCLDMETKAVRDPAFDAVAAVCVSNLEIDGRAVLAWGFNSLRGVIEPTIVAGRAPRAADEVALGATTLAALHKRIGDSVNVPRGDTSVQYRVVGQSVLPSPATVDAQPLADHASFTSEGISSALGDNAESSNWVIVARLSSDQPVSSIQRDDDGRAAFRSGPGELPSVPLEVDRLRQVDRLPLVLGAFLALLATTAITHALVTTLRRRRHDLAILQALGFRRRQVRATVHWEATAMAAVGLVIGIPLGIIVGGFVWGAVAGNLGVATVEVVPLTGVLLIAFGVAFGVNVIAALATRISARDRPADALRTAE